MADQPEQTREERIKALREKLAQQSQSGAAPAAPAVPTASPAKLAPVIPLPAAQTPLPTTATPDLAAMRDNLRQSSAPGGSAAKPVAPVVAKPGAASKKSSPLDGILDNPKMPKIIRGKPWILGVSAGAILILVITVVLGVTAGLSKPSTQNIDPNSFSPGPTAEVPIDVTPVVTETLGAKARADFWTQIKTTPAAEISPMIAKGMTPDDLVGIGLVVAVIVFCILDARSRKNKQGRGVMINAIMSIVAGLVTIPLLNFASGSLGNEFIALLIVVAVWVIGPIGAAVNQEDLSGLVTATALMAFVGYFVGQFSMLVPLGPVYQQAWGSWQGVTTFGGFFRLILALRLGELPMTAFVYALGLVAIFLAVMEVGKGRNKWIPLLVGVVSTIAWALLQTLGAFLLNRLVSPTMSVDVIVLLEVMVPTICYLLALSAAVGIGIAVSDNTTPQSRERAQGLAGMKSERSVADFAQLATVFALVLGVIIRVGNG